MRFLVSILLTPFLVSCGIENLLTPKTDINTFISDVAHGNDNAYVGKTIKIDAKVQEIVDLTELIEPLIDAIDPKEGYYVLGIETNDWKQGWFIDFLVETCDDKYVEGETYTLMIYVRDVYDVDLSAPPEFSEVPDSYHLIIGELK